MQSSRRGVMPVVLAIADGVQDRGLLACSQMLANRPFPRSGFKHRSMLWLLPLAGAQKTAQNPLEGAGEG